MGCGLWVSRVCRVIQTPVRNSKERELWFVLGNPTLLHMSRHTVKCRDIENLGGCSLRSLVAGCALATVKLHVRDMGNLPRTKGYR